MFAPQKLQTLPCFSAVLICANPRNLRFLIRNFGLTGQPSKRRSRTREILLSRRRGEPFPELLVQDLVPFREPGLLSREQVLSRVENID